MIVSIEKPGTPAELVHYGIKGMKWGVRKKRETSGRGGGKKEISSEKRAKREAKAQKYDKRAATYQKRIDQVKARPKQTAVQKYLIEGDRRAIIAELEKAKASAERAAEAKRQGKLTRGQKQLLIGGAVVGALLVGGYLAANVNSGKTRQIMNRGKFFVTGKKFKFKENPMLARRDMSPEDIKRLIQSDINPGFPDEKGTDMNCRRATFAYELRRRGYDVQATRTPDGNGQNAAGLMNAIDKKYKDISTESKAVIERVTTNDLSDPRTRHVKAFAKRNASLRDFKEDDFIEPNGIFDRLSREPDRSRGEVSLMYMFGGGHSVAYEVINGKAHIFDNQTGDHFTSIDDLEASYPAISTGGFTRLDNMDLDTHFLERWVKNVK